MKVVISFLIGVAICLGLAYWLQIEPEKEYGWFAGCIDGLLLVPNWLISLVKESWYIKAPIHTSMYNMAWWICGILNIIYWLWAAAGTVVTVIKGK